MNDSVHMQLEKISAFRIYKSHGRDEVRLMFPEHLSFCEENQSKTLSDVRVELLGSTVKKHVKLPRIFAATSNTGLAAAGSGRALQKLR